jgi:hypothetical protein
MAIRKRISHGAELAPDTGDDNVINHRAFDDRGVVDPTSDVIGKSYITDMLGPDADGETIRGVIGTISFNVAQAGQQPAPTEMRTVDILANTRVMFSPGFNVERTYRNRIRSPLTGIRAMCVVVCHSGSPKAVASCSNMSCPLWAFRMGKNGLR